MFNLTISNMNKTLIILIIALSTATTLLGAQKIRPTLLRDGFILNGVDGKLIGGDINDVWFFELGSDITDENVVIKAGNSLELLPSVTLENMVADANESSTGRYMLEGRITKYKGKNFIFPEYFSKLQPKTLPKKGPEQPEPTEAASKQDNEQKPTINDPNDLLTIPQEIIEKLKAAKATTTAKTQNEQISSTTEETTPITAKRYTQNINSVFFDRTALLAKQVNNRFMFLLDAFGRNVPQVSLRLLPCEVLELTEQRQSAVPEPVRFKIAGIVTKYKGNNYLLLQKATRIYSHGNFGR